MRRTVVLGLTGGAMALSAFTLFAHDTWLLPDRFHVASGATIVLDLTSGMQFPEAESPVTPDRLAATGMRLAGKTAALEPQTPTASAQRLAAKAPVPGTAVLWAVSKPRTLSLDPEQVREYLEEIGAPASVEARWRKQQRWRESYAKLAKTYVAVGSAADDRSWQEPAGLRLEIVPLQDPTRLEQGSEIGVRVLLDGKPLPGLSLTAAPPNHEKAVMTHTDADGRAAFLLDRAGPWLLRCTLIKESTAPDTDWESLFATLSISVRPKQGR
jgi:uncharacterized GH25 family protein